MEPNTAYPLFSFLQMAILALGVVLYLKMLRHFAGREEAQRPLTDDEYLGRLALRRGTSEYRLFHRASVDWNVSENRIESDFKAYLMEGRMPHYVRDFVRRKRQAEEVARDCGDHCPAMPPDGSTP